MSECPPPSLSGSEAKISIAPSRVAGLEGEYLLADQGYDSDALVKAWEADGMTVLIPSRKNRLEPREMDSTIYRERNTVERLFNRLKQCRRVATRYEKTARNYLAMLQTVFLAPIQILVEYLSKGHPATEW